MLDRVFLVVRYSITLNISCHSFLACRAPIEKSADSLMRVPLCVICCLSLVAFNILSLSLVFGSLIIMCLGVFLLGFILPGTLCFLGLIDYFLSHLKEVFSYQLFKYFLSSFLFFFSFWDPCNANVGAFNVVPASLIAQLVKNPPAMQETWIRSLGWEDPLEKEKATHCSIPAWRISWTI